MRSALARGLRWLHRLEDAFLVLLLLFMIGLAVTQIVLRNAVDGGLLWGDPLLRVLVLWVALWGAVVASREQRHISMDILNRFLPPAGRRWATVFNALFAAGICAALAWFSLEFVRMEFEAPSMAFARVPTWLCESIMPLGFGLMSLRFAFYAAQAALGLPLKEQSPA